MSDLAGVYEKIMMDEEWYERMRKIKNLAYVGNDQELYADHGMRHAMRVAEHAVNFVDECYQFFGEDGVKERKFYAFGHEQDFYYAAIAGLLHDIGIVDGRKNHAERSRKMAADYLQKFSLHPNDIHVVTGAISCHSNGKELVNMVDAALAMGDKMDIARSRILAFYDETLLPKLSPLQTALLDVKRVNYFIDYEHQHGILEWGVIRNPRKGDFDKIVEELLETVMEEWDKCITVPRQVTEEFLHLPFTFIVDDLAT